MVSRNEIEALAKTLEAMAAVLAEHADRLRGSARIVRLALEVEGDGDVAGIPSANELVGMQVREVLNPVGLRALADDAIVIARGVDSLED